MNAPLLNLHRAACLYELDRMRRNDAALQVDMLLDRVSQPEPVQMCADVDHEPPVSPWIFWPLVCAFSLILTFGAYELATRVLPVVLPWIWSHS